MAAPENRFKIIGTTTEQRKKIRGDYLICVSPIVKQGLRLRKFAVIVHSVSDNEKSKELKVICNIKTDHHLSEDTVAADQSVRNAIGIPVLYDREQIFVSIYPLSVTFMQRLFQYVSQILGRRFLFFRLGKADISDMEKDIARIPKDAFSLLGTEIGNKVVIENAFRIKDGDKFIIKKLSIKCYELLPEIEKRRKEFEEASFTARFPNAEILLKVSPDISKVFLDAHGRDQLGINANGPLLDAVRIRRHLVDLFLREFREFGIIFFLSLLTIIQLIPKDNIKWPISVLIFFVSILLSLFVVLMNIRARIK